MLRSDIINYFIKKRNFQSYLEIGTRDKSHNFNLIECKEKFCIDPDPNAVADLRITSDNFFEICNKKFDIIFIDGLHEGHQVYRDIVNSINHLNENGIIVCHDCNPQSWEAEKGYEDYDGLEIWNGDSWKGFVKYRLNSEFLCYVINEDEGCGIIDTSKTTDVKEKVIININALTYENLIVNRENLLSLKKFEEIEG